MVVTCKNKTNLFQICLGTFILFLSILNNAKAGHYPNPASSPYSCDYLGIVNIDGINASIDTEVAFFDPDNVICGLYIVKQRGEYGIVHIYGDDPDTNNIDEGASINDILTVKIWDNVKKVEYSGEDLHLTKGNVQNGFFTQSAIPPIWQNQTGFILNIDTKSHFAPPTKTPYICNYIGNITINGELIDIGDEIGIFDPNGVLCGHFRIKESGRYGMVHIYGDNPSTLNIDEGAEDGDVLTFKIWDNDLSKEWQTSEELFIATEGADGSFNNSFLPPVWTKDTGYILNITVNPIIKADPSINSMTNKSTVTISWNESSNAKGFSWIVDKSTDTKPDEIIMGSNLPGLINFDQGEGIYYVHIKSVNTNDEWSPSYHIGPWQLVEGQLLAPVVTGDSFTNNVRPTWKWKSAGEPGTGSFRFQLNSENAQWTETQETSFTANTDLESSNILYVQEKDIFGEWSISGSFMIIIDTIPPNKVNISGISITNNTRPIWTWNSGGGGNGEFRYQIDGEIVNLWIITTDKSYTPSTEFNDGESHIIYVQERDEAGNWSESAYFETQIDTSPPNKVNLSGISPTNNAKPTWNWNSGGGGGIGEFRFQLNGEMENSWNITTENSYTPYTEFNDTETHILFVQERDEAGNWSESAYFGIQIDKIPPNKVNLSGNTLTNNTRPTWKWISGGGGNGEFRYQIDGEIVNSWIITTETSYTSLKEFNDGESHILYVQERDEAANWSETAEFKIQIDTSPPNKVNVSGVSPSNNPRPTWNWISGGENGNGKFRYQINDQLDNLWNHTTESSYTALTDFYDGEERTLYVQEQDDAGNWSNSGSFTIVYYVYVDSDNDGLSDEDEIYYGTNINKADTDEDGINDYDELIIYETDPINVDTDDDGIKDGKEIADNTNAKDKNSFNLNRPPEIPTVWVDSPDEIITTDNVWLQSSNYKDKDINEIHAKTYWKVKRADISVYECCDEPFSFSFVATKNDSEEYMTKYNITGLISGFQYIYMVGYEGSESTFISWSDEHLITVGETEQDNNLKIKKGIELADYQMVSFVQWMNNPISIDVLGNDIWEKYGKSFKFGTYNPLFGAGGYIEYGENLIIQPGKSYWFLSADGYNVSTSGAPVSTSEDIYVKLTYNVTDKNGWNMIACPNNSDYYWDDIELFVTNENWDIIFPKTPISDLDEHDTPYIFNFLWRWENGTYEPDTQKMIRYKGYWVNVNTEDVSTENVYLIFPEKHQKNFIKSDLLKKQKNAPSRLRKKSLELCGSPPLPIEVIDESKSSGCFIEMIFSSLGIIGY